MALKLARRPDTPQERDAFRVMEAEALAGRLDFIERRYLLGLARMGVAHNLAHGERPEVGLWEAPSPRLAQDGACFVTINSGHKLRGCIGSLLARKPLMHDAIDNAVSAAFHDDRFPPLVAAELPLVRFSISVLETPLPLAVESADELLGMLEPGRHGLILRKGADMATYLPHVWKSFPGKEGFLSNLCVKAGLDADAWKEPAGMDFYTYEAQEFSE